MRNFRHEICCFKQTGGAMKRKILLILLSTMMVSSCFSDETPSYVSPYKRHKTYGPFRNNTLTGNLGQKIIHLVDNSTIGAVQSALSILHIPYSFIDVSLIGDRNGRRLLKFDSYNSPNSEIVQFVVKGNPINSGAYSLGVGQITPEGYEGIQDHEAGHSVASSSLGPLYIPVVVATYANNHGHGGFVEDWADMEGNPKDYALTGSIQSGLANIDVNGEKVTVLLLNLAINQTQQQSEAGHYAHLDSLKIYDWLKTELKFNLGSSLAEDCDCDQEIINEASISLLEKQLELVIADDLTSEHGLSGLIQSAQTYGQVRFTKDGIEVVPMRWNASLGLELNPERGLKVQLSAGPTLGGIYRNDNFSLMGGASVKIGLDYKDYVRLSNTTDWEFHSNGDYAFRNTTELSNKNRDIRRNFGALHYIDFGLKHQYEELDLGSEGQVRSNYLGGFAGIRF